MNIKEQTLHRIESIIEQKCNQSSREAHYSAAFKIFEEIVQPLKDAGKESEGEAPSGEGEKMAESYWWNLIIDENPNMSALDYEGIKKAIEQRKELHTLRQQLEGGKAPESAWVSVEDGLPVAEGKYLGGQLIDLSRIGMADAFIYAVVDFILYNSPDQDGITGRFQDRSRAAEKVTHWQPLPALPESAPNSLNI